MLHLGTSPTHAILVICNFLDLVFNSKETQNTTANKQKDTMPWVYSWIAHNTFYVSQDAKKLSSLHNVIYFQFYSRLISLMVRGEFSRKVPHSTAHHLEGRSKYQIWLSFL